MDEYIKREEAIAKCREIAACEWNHRAAPISWSYAYEQFSEDLEELPAADVAPVRHGRWIKAGYFCGESEFICSVCGESEWRTSSSRMKYCMFCVAKMDLEQFGKDELLQESKGENENE